MAEQGLMPSGNMVEKEYATPSGTVHYWVPKNSDARLPWIVFLPGLTADHRLFDKQLAYFADGPAKANCLAWDAPAHGASRPFALDFSMDDMARMLRGILESEGIEAPVLVGQSMGGYVSQAYMDLYPGDAAGFVSIDSAPLKRSYFSWLEIAALRHTEFMYRSIPWKTLVRIGSKGTATSAYGQSLMADMMHSFTKAEYCALAGHGFKVLADAAAADRPYAIDCPTLLICGTRDGAGSAKRYNRAWTKREGLPMAWIEGAGHNSNTDEPEQVNRLIEEFIAKTRTPKA